jgi:hypothetical protein
LGGPESDLDRIRDTADDLRRDINKLANINASRTRPTHLAALLVGQGTNLSGDPPP